jgi:hypothetical protein
MKVDNLRSNGFERPGVKTEGKIKRMDLLVIYRVIRIQQKVDPRAQCVDPRLG